MIVLVDLGDTCIWEIDSIDGNKSRAMLRRVNEIQNKRPMTILMDGYNEWHYDNLEDLQGLTEFQTKVIFIMKKWGHNSYRIEREGKIIFT